jgi:hypothetical protein
MPKQKRSRKAKLPVASKATRKRAAPPPVSNPLPQRSFNVAGTELLNPTDVEPDLASSSSIASSPKTRSHRRSYSSSSSIESGHESQSQSPKLAKTKVTKQRSRARPPTGTFRCEMYRNIECSTGQTKLAQSRKAVSDHFGRNKRETRLIPRWALICRKHYQRGAYHPATWQPRKLELIRRQFSLIEEDLPGCMYLIGFKSNELSRLAEYNELVARDPHSDHTDEVPTGPSDTPIPVLTRLYDDYVAGNRPRSMQECKRALADITALLEAREISEVPPITFVPQIGLGDNNTVRVRIREPIVRSSSPSRPSLSKPR